MSKGTNRDRRCVWGPAVMTVAAIALASFTGSTR
jgi:hypothetical protein